MNSDRTNPKNTSTEPNTKPENTGIEPQDPQPESGDLAAEQAETRQSSPASPRVSEKTEEAQEEA
ncbi:hypothetical protein IFO70_22385 [Phormidium tenue FACHB-886]|nr:hypothetical protein [Phormidium tenue FACHB-886]